MKHSFATESIENTLIRLIALDWYLDSINEEDICSSKCLLKLFKDEIKLSLEQLEEFYVEFSSNDMLVLKKKKKVKRNVRRKTKKKAVRKGRAKNKKS